VAGPEVDGAGDRERGAVEDLAELPLPGRDQGAVELQAGDADDRHRADPPGVQRQQPVAVLQQDHPVGGDPGRQGDVRRRAGQGRPPVRFGQRVGVEAGVEDGEQGPPDDLVQPPGRDGAGDELPGGPPLGNAEPGEVEAGVGGGHRVAHGVLEVRGHEPVQPQSCLRVRRMPGWWQA
jgi:hypothetical protein